MQKNPLVLNLLLLMLFTQGSGGNPSPLLLSVQPEKRYQLWQTEDLRVPWIYKQAVTTTPETVEYEIALNSATERTLFYKLQPTPPAPTIDWFTSYRGERSQMEAHGHFLLACSDGGFLQIGESGSPSNSGRILVIKVDENGALIWKQETALFIEGSLNLGNSALEVADGYIILGSQQSNGSNSGQNSMIAKLNKSTGVPLFIETFDSGGADAFEHAATNDTGYIAVGYRQAMDSENTFYTEGQGQLTFLNSNGVQIASFDLNNYLSQAYRIYPTQGGYIISGQAAENTQYGLIKIDSTGTVLWHRQYGFESVDGSADDDHCFALDVSTHGHLFLSGHTRFGYQSSGLNQTNNWDTLTCKIDGSGNLIWIRRQGNPRGFDPRYIHDEAWGIRATPDGGCLVVAGSGDEYENYSAHSQDELSDKWVVYLIKYAADGVLEWETTFGDPGEALGWDWAGEDIVLTSDGAAVIAVDNASFGFLKITPLFNP